MVETKKQPPQILAETDFVLKYGGGGEIRTLGGLTHDGFQDIKLNTIACQLLSFGSVLRSNNIA